MYELYTFYNSALSVNPLLVKKETNETFDVGSKDVLQDTIVAGVFALLVRTLLTVAAVSD